MKQKILWLALSFLLVASLVLASCAEEVVEEVVEEEEEVVEEEEIIPLVGDEWFRAAAEPYRGITLTGITESTPSSVAIVDLIEEFEELTGINVDYVLTSWDEMYTKQMGDMVTSAGIYDFVYTEQDIIFAYLAMGWLTDLTELWEARPDLLYPDLNLDDFLPFLDFFKDEDGNLHGLIMESFLKVYVYRADLFDHPGIRAAFSAKYGWELRPPLTWEEYEQIAKFFHEESEDILGYHIFGHAEGVKAVVGPYQVVETYLPSHGVPNWGIDMVTFRATTEEATKRRAAVGLPPPDLPLMDSPEALEALERFIRLFDYAPPGVRAFSWEGAIGVPLAIGDAAQSLVYGETVSWIELNPDFSKVMGKIGVALPPTSPGVLAAAEAGIGYIGYYDGGAFGIPHSSKQKEATVLLLQYITRPEGARYLVEEAFVPIRHSALEVMIGTPVDVATGYFTLYKEKAHLFGAAPPFEFHKAILEGPIFKWVHEAIAGKVTPEVALREMAKEMDILLGRLGY